MATLPAANYLSAAARTEGEMKTAFEDQRNVIAQLVGGQAEATLTLATDQVTPGSEDSNRPKGLYAIETEVAAAADDLKNIIQTNLPDGSLLLIHAANAARVVTVKHSAGGAGQISLKAAVDLVLDDPKKWLFLKRTGTTWEELAHFTLANDRIPVLAKTAAYTVVGQDNGKLIDATSGTWTLSLFAAATAGNGFQFWLKVGTGTITVDPNAAELLDGAATMVFGPGSLAQIVCDGAAWRVTGLWGIARDNSWTGKNDFKQAYSNLFDAGTGSLAWTPNMNDGNVQRRTANVSGILVTPSNAVAGATLILVIKQDATGGRVVTWPSTFHFPGGTEPTLSTAANAIDVWSGVYDGTNWLGTLSKDHKA